MNRRELEALATTMDVARLRALGTKDMSVSAIRLAEVRLIAEGIARSLNVDVVRFVRSCGFRYDKPTPTEVSAARCGND